MKTYQLKSIHPAWHFDPATFGQLKVLRFFGIDISRPLTKGVCSGIIGRLFRPRQQASWTAYVYTTGDEEHVPQTSGLTIKPFLLAPRFPPTGTRNEARRSIQDSESA